MAQKLRFVGPASSHAQVLLVEKKFPIWRPNLETSNARPQVLKSGMNVVIHESISGDSAGVCIRLESVVQSVLADSLAQALEIFPK